MPKPESPNAHEAPAELTDALARIDRAKKDYFSLAREMEVFLYEYVKGMIRGYDRESGSVTIQLRHPSSLW